PIAGLRSAHHQRPTGEPTQYLCSRLSRVLAHRPTFAPNPPVGANGRYPLPDGINVYYFVDPPSAYRIPLAEFWNLTVQHQFRPSLTAEAAYVGNVGRHLYTNPNANQAVPGPGDLDPRRRLFKFGLTQGI